VNDKNDVEVFEGIFFDVEIWRLEIWVIGWREIGERAERLRRLAQPCPLGILKGIQLRLYVTLQGRVVWLKS